MKIGEMSGDTPVGTTMAIMELRHEGYVRIISACTTHRKSSSNYW